VALQQEVKVLGEFEGEFQARDIEVKNDA
jgi:hypothetical protein